MERLKDSQRESLERATKQYQANLDLAMPYLSARGLTRTTCEMFRAGVVPSEGANLADSRYAGRLSIPYIAADGTVVALRYRALDNETQPKYLSRTGSTQHLFGVSCLLGDSMEAVVVEGEIDQMTLTQMGVTAVGVPGVKAWKHSWRHLFEDFSRVIVLADGDEPGREFGREMVKELDATLVELPPGEDTNSIYVQHGASELRELLRAL